MKEGKCIILSAPSGAGKTTILKELMKDPRLNLAFSVSACNRNPREGEINGKDYYFLSTEEFKRKIDQNEFLEWEEVYEGRFYGTLNAEVDRIRKIGQNVAFDIDVAGGVNIKKTFGNEALSIFIMPPSIEILKERLAGRGTEDNNSLAQRVDKAEYEMSFAKEFDVVIINEILEKAILETKSVITEFLKN